MTDRRTFLQGQEGHWHGRRHLSDISKHNCSPAIREEEVIVRWPWRRHVRIRVASFEFTLRFGFYGWRSGSCLLWFLIDMLLHLKKWNENSSEEREMFLLIASVYQYSFCVRWLKSIDSTNWKHNLAVNAFVVIYRKLKVFVHCQKCRWNLISTLVFNMLSNYLDVLLLP